MPLIWDEELYKKAYSQEKSRKSELRYRNILIDTLLEVLPGFSTGNSVLLIGCGFGYTIEVLLDRGVSVMGVDPSPYIQGKKNEKSRIPARIYSSLDKIRGKYDWVITEFVIESYNPDTELPEFDKFLTDIEKPLKRNGHVAHIFAGLLEDGNTHDWSLGITWLPIEDWIPHAPHHYWLDWNTEKVGGGI